jgi:ribosomal protein L15
VEVYHSGTAHCLAFEKPSLISRTNKKHTGRKQERNKEREGTRGENGRQNFKKYLHKHFAFSDSSPEIEQPIPESLASNKTSINSTHKYPQDLTGVSTPIVGLMT